MSVADGLEIRRATDADRAGVLELLAESLGRDAADPRYAALYAWKHDENVFGRSPAWVACDGSRLAGFRVLMRWEFIDGGAGGARRRAVRAVDTATHPAYQGRGIFRRLTLHALDELRHHGTSFVFNTPNDQSRPGYLTMGWQVVGRLPAAVRPIGLRGAARGARARVPAERWSTPSTAGEAATDVLADRAALDAVVAALPPARGLRTSIDGAFLRWRYGTPLLGYRAVTARGGVETGVALFRVRQRGPAREAALCELLVPRGDRRAEGRLTRAVARAADADYVIRLSPARVAPGPMVRIPGQGPLLTWRAVDEPAIPRAWDLSLGDIELF